MSEPERLGDVLKRLSIPQPKPKPRPKPEKSK